MRIVLYSMVICCLFILTNTSHAAIYKWVDKNGTVTFKDTPPPSGVNVEEYTPRGGAIVEFNDGRSSVNESQASTVDKVDETSRLSRRAAGKAANKHDRKSFPKVELFVTSWCGYCKRAIDFLRDNNVPFKAYDVEKSRQASKKHISLAPSGAVPVAIINGKMIQGFSPEKYSRALGL